MAVTRGRPPTEAEESQYKALTARTPEDSLQRAETLANFVFANVAVVGTLLTGLGLVADGGALLESAPEVFGVPLPVLLVGLSLVAAIVALLPALKRVNPAHIDDVAKWYEGQVRRRGIAAIVALVLFAGAIITATVSASESGASDPRLSASWTGTGEEASATVKAELSGLASSATGRMTVHGVSAGEPRAELFRSSTRADSSGDVTVEATLGGVDGYSAIEARFVVRDEGEVIEDASLRMPRPE